jgi:hypothetical protein
MRIAKRHDAGEKGLRRWHEALGEGIGEDQPLHRFDLQPDALVFHALAVGAGHHGVHASADAKVEVGLGDGPWFRAEPLLQ